MAEALAKFVKLGGDNVTGSYTFRPKGTNNYFHLEGMSFDTDSSTDVTFARGKLTAVDSANNESLVNVGYVKEQTAKFRGSQPVFVSGKFMSTDRADRPNNAITLYGSQYLPQLYFLSGRIWTDLFCLLKYDSHADFYGKDLSWVDLVGAGPPETIPGYDMPGARGRIPYPVGYDIFVEYEVPWDKGTNANSNTGFPFPLDPGISRRVRLNISSWMEHALFIGTDGALWLQTEMNMSGVFNTPFSAWTSAQGNTDLQFRYYLVVYAWSYLDFHAPFPGSMTLKRPVIFFPDGYSEFDGNPYVPNQVTYDLKYEDFPMAITWTWPAGREITAIDDSNTGTARVHLSFIATSTGESIILPIIVTAKYSDVQGNHLVTKELKFKLSSKKLIINPTVFNNSPMNCGGHPLPPYYPSPQPYCSLATSNEQGAVVWSLDPATISNPNATFAIRNNTLYLDNIKAPMGTSLVNVTAIVHAKDSRGAQTWDTNLTINCTSGTGDSQWIVTGTVWGISPVTPAITADRLVGMVVEANGATAKIASATSTTLTLATALTVPIPAGVPGPGNTVTYAIKILGDGNGVAEPLPVTCIVQNW